MITLRPYQGQAVDDLRSRIAGGVRRIVVVAPTGSGKTTIAAYIIASAVSRGSYVLFMAHRRELISQAYSRLIQLGVPEMEVGIIMASDPRWRPGAHVQVASIDTLRNRAKPRADVVFVDECHRAVAASYRTIAEYYPGAVHLGLTATPYRADGSGLSDAYDDLLVVSSPQQLIDEGHLVAPRVYTVPAGAGPDLSAVRVKRGDYDQRALGDTMDTSVLVGNIVDHWKRLANGERTVAFASSVAHSQHIAEQFRQAGVAAEHLDGTTPTKERDEILSRLDAGETRVVSNCGVLCEGWDQPAVKCAILARPTKSTGLYLQQAGRILRPWNNTPALILDHAGCALEHGLPQADRDFSLEGDKGKGGRKGDAPVRVCPECDAVVHLSASVCPECGEILRSDDAEKEIPTEQDGTLVEISDKRIELERLYRVAEQRGYKPGWVYYRYKDRFGEAPPKRKPARKSNDSVKFLAEVLRDSGVSWSKIDAAIK